VEIWFDVNLSNSHEEGDIPQDTVPATSVIDECFNPVPPLRSINLLTKELGLLEDLRLNMHSTYEIIGDSMEGSSSLSSLERLHLELSEDRREMVAKWLKLASNVKELNLSLGPNSVEQAHRSSAPSEFLIAENLRILRVRPSYYRMGGLLATGFLLRNLTCHSLVELQLLMVHNGVHLYNFVHRSMPPLRVLNLELILNNNTTLRPEQVIDTLSLIPTISELKLEVLCNNGFQRAILNPLTHTCNPSDPNAPFSLLPALETLELGSFYVSVVEVVVARWRCSSRRTLKSVTLSGYGPEDQVSLVGFRLGDDPARLPARMDLLKECIKEGLRFSISK